MNAQLSMFDKTLTEQFLAYDRDRPDMYRELVKLAREWQEKGRGRWSINGMFEVLRWQRYIDYGDDKYKCNNNYRAFYARKLMAEYPEFHGMFELRERRAA